MRRSRFMESHTLAVLKEGKAGVPVAEILASTGLRHTCFLLQVPLAQAPARDGARERVAEEDVQRSGTRDMPRSRISFGENANAVREARGHRDPGCRTWDVDRRILGHNENCRV